MRKIQYLLITLAVLLLLTGCTTFQAAEARRAVTVGLFESVLEGAIDELLPVEKSAHRQYKDDIKERAEDARRKQEREVRHYEKEANSMLDALDEAERRSGQLQPYRALTDYEQQEEERLRRREETLESWAEFDEVMRELETAEEQNNDPRLTRITGE